MCGPWLCGPCMRDIVCGDTHSLHPLHPLQPLHPCQVGVQTALYMRTHQSLGSGLQLLTEEDRVVRIHRGDDVPLVPATRLDERLYHGGEEARAKGTGGRLLGVGGSEGREGRA